MRTNPRRRSVPGPIVRRLLCVALAGALAGGAVAGCGDDEKRAGGADLTALRCPLVPTGEQVGGVEQYEPAADAFDTAQLVGAPVEDARATAAEHGCDIVVAMQDGEGVAVATDIDPKRIYVYTEDGVVTRIEGVGGGI